MKTVGVIAEFNPFHNGHAYLIDKAREITGADRLVYYAENDTLFIVQCVTHYKKV